MDCNRNKLFKDDIDYVFNPFDRWSLEDEVMFHSFNHVVLFQLPLVVENFNPHQSVDVWDQNNVRLPCSKESKYPEINEGSQKVLKNRWELIEQSLLREFYSINDLERAIKKYNTRYESIWKFDALHNLVETQFSADEREIFFKETLKNIIFLALRLPYLIQCPIPLLKQGMNKSISMTQEQAASILANGFLCTFPRRNTFKKDSEYANYPDINFQRLFGGEGQVKVEKLKCIIHYFERVTKSMPNGVLTFKRQSIDKSQFPNWKEDPKSFQNIKYFISSQHKIENASAMLQVDFCNKFIGGGVLGNGSVQEEIRFSINPELIVARLFTECLSDQEAFVITGTEQFCRYVGYASTFQYAGTFIDQTPSDSFRRRKCKIVAIDAKKYKNYSEQFKEANIIRELNKAYAGFYNSNDENRPVCTGLWGCGAFNGHPVKSALIQLMACRLARRNFAFLTLNDENLEDHLEDLFKYLIDNYVTISRLFNILIKYQASSSSNIEHLTNFIKHEVLNSPTNSNNNNNNNIMKQQPLRFNLKKPTAATPPPEKLSCFKTCFDTNQYTAQDAMKVGQDKRQYLRFERAKQDDKKKFDNVKSKFKDFRECGESSKSSKKTNEKKHDKSRLLDALDDDFCDNK